MKRNTMLIIGAGPVGLAVASALKRAKIAYEHVEADDDVGGNWHHGVYDHVHLVSPKKYTQYPDFPMPEEYPDYPSRAQMRAYYGHYAKSMGLAAHIQFNTKVVQAQPLENGLWRVTFDDLSAHTYKGVIVCAGQHWACKYPKLPGQFDGAFIHAKAYKRPEQLKGQRVLVIGAGNSGCDIALAAHTMANAKVHWLVRSGPWFVPKYFWKKPLAEWLPCKTPLVIERLFTRAVIQMVLGSNTRYNLPKPTSPLFERLPTANTQILKSVKNGHISTHQHIRNVEGHTITFDDGQRADFDTIVCATGYKFSLPFLPRGLVQMDDDHMNLIAGSLVQDYKNLYIVGMVQSRKGLGTLATPYAELLANFILAQQQIQEPLSNILMTLGFGAMQHTLLEPSHILMQIKHGSKIANAIPSIANKLTHSTKYTKASPRFDWPNAIDPNMTVF